MKELRVSPVRKGERGAAAIIVGLFVLFLGAGFAAIAIDLGHLYVARNELQNAADAGALAGAQALYNDEGTVINTSANDTAAAAAEKNLSEGVPVESDYDDTDNSGDIQRGHWSFGIGPNTTPGFHPDPSTEVIVLAGKTDEDLDDMDGEGGRDIFINAVRVVTRRRTTPVRSFFAGILGHPSTELSADAVAYRGFAGSLLPGEADAPIAICEESLEIIGEEIDYCSMGRMTNSGHDVQSHDTAAWTDFAQASTSEDPDNPDDPCQGGTNADDVTDLLVTVEEDGSTRPCGQGNPNGLFQENMATIGGEVTPALQGIIDCWTSEYATNTRLVGGKAADCDNVLCEDYPEGEDCTPCEDPIDWYTGPTDEGEEDPGPDGIPDVPWSLTLPVISCGDDNPGPCNMMTGAVTLYVVWITRQGTDPHYTMAPDHMGDWVAPDYDPEDPEGRSAGEQRWDSFVDYFDLVNVDESPAPYTDMSLYFKPDCDHAETAGVTGGHNFGVLAKVPVLVK